MHVSRPRFGGEFRCHLGEERVGSVDISYDAVESRQEGLHLLALGLDVIKELFVLELCVGEGGAEVRMLLGKMRMQMGAENGLGR